MHVWIQAHRSSRGGHTFVYTGTQVVLIMRRTTFRVGLKVMVMPTVTIKVA